MKCALCVTAMLAALVAGAQDAAPEYRISGVVVNALTGQPLSQARVTLAPEGTGKPETASFMTSADGRFAFEHIPAGRWALTGERKGFLRQGYEQRPEPAMPPLSVVAGRGTASENLVFRMMPPAVVRGRVAGEDGQPVAGAILQVFINLPVGYRIARAVKAAQTDERGEYRIGDLPPLPCYVLAIGPPPEEKDDPAYAPLYYPGTPDPQAAQVIALQPGGEAVADFSLARINGHDIKVTGGTGSEILALSTPGLHGGDALVAMLAPQSPHVFRGVAPGRYKLMSAAPGNPLPDIRVKRIEVGTQDVSVAMPLPAPVTVSAKVTVADGDAAIASRVGMLLFADAETPIYGMKSGSGVLKFPGTLPGRYRIVLGEPALYISSLAAEGARVVNGFIEIPDEGKVQLNVAISAAGGRIQGHVTSGGKPAIGVLVALVPRGGAENRSDYQAFQSETDGSFDFQGVRPGEYIVFATMDWRTQFRVPSAIPDLLAAGTPVKVEAKGLVRQNLELLGAN